MTFQRIDLYPTHVHEGFQLHIGRPFPYGAHPVPGGVNFSVFSRHATRCDLVLFRRGEARPMVEIPFPEEFRIGNVFTMIVFDLDIENIEYGFRMDGPYAPHLGHHFDHTRILLDPYARAIGHREVWGKHPAESEIYPHRARIVYTDFDWQSDRPLGIPHEDLIVYEMHVRGFTRHPSASVKYPGTFAAIREKIDYLKQLGVNCVELMPVHEFDELENLFTNPETGEPLMNFWGYSTVGFFAPKASYAATGRFGTQVEEFKAMVKDLHRNGIEVMLDVVFNHTAEGGEGGPTISYRGIDNKTYYMLAPDGRYYNFAGTGNTMNSNNPIVREMVIEALRYWAAEFHIDGFRFDLASILARDQNGVPLKNPPLVEALAFDPILANTKLIAEAWDAGGLYQVGSFPDYRRWSEWNGQYRDSVRRWLKGDDGQAYTMALRILGSPDLYAKRGPAASVNFITAHDGFTLHDLVSYNEKHNEANGEANRDGANDNNSWNHGVEGPTDDPAINRLRQRQMQNGVGILLTSQGVPMLLMGDEVAHTKHGNNNTYAHDSDLNWFDWQRLELNAGMFDFVRHCIAFRKAHPALRQRRFLQQKDYLDVGYPDISFHGVRAFQPDWGHASRTLAFMLAGEYAPHPDGRPDDFIYVGMNMYWESLAFQLPRLPLTRAWHLFANTGASDPAQAICPPGEETRLAHQTSITLLDRSIVILVGR